ncbi:hypothetical protein SAMN05428945_4963 [Streptomyces sp. 2224.1]|nr:MULTISPECIES: DUF6424 family protein [unclassified Streptomyces]PBC80536.1 hypothetical protein BX261_0371 [Streptomyces sp. 2321.6]SDR58190.1 hypothetical protein SAMN05216511_6850 [Streptomyces sp. KS_16]SEB78588.1 hypothetical protein SAMN05428940_0371 [Streptomyces sp. 2133.1]SED46191.1 hypothetical protein SAMN05428945_4963 [Streptomyces sp. 2224.1]SEF14102.1 hypothetical protein SAMN05428954_6901 [Streptomyces sp. 2112.3]
MGRHPQPRPGGIESENHPWKIRLVEHPKRFESSHFRAAKTTARKILHAMDDADLPYGPRPVDPDQESSNSERWEMHHGGSLWVKGSRGWRMYRARVGIEWSMQFCADPGKVDRLRQDAAELVDAFPLTLPALAELGYQRAEELLRTPIRDADGVEAWTDSLFNACVPLSHGNHQGILPSVPGEHHYPWPVKGADFVRYEDFQLWVTLPDGTHGAVAPVDRRGSGDGHVRLAFVPEGSAAAPAVAEAQDRGLMAVVPPDSEVALQAFAQQVPPDRHTASGPLSSDATRRGSDTVG